MKFVKDKKIVLPVLGIIVGFPLWILSARLMGDELTVLRVLLSIVGGALLFISLGYLTHNILILRHLQLVGPDSASAEDMEADNTTDTVDGAEAASQRKLSRIILALCSLAFFTGLALFITSALVDSRSMSFVYFYSGMALLGLSLVSLEMHISKIRRPELLRDQEIEANGEHDIILLEKAGARTFIYLLSMILVSLCIYTWFDPGIDYARFVFWIVVLSCAIFLAHYYYYKKRV